MTPEVDRLLGVALAKSLVADLRAAPALEEALRSHRLDRDGLRNIVVRDLTKAVRGVSGPALFPNLRRTVRIQMDADEARLRSGVGQWEALGSALGAAIGAAATVYSAKIQARAATSVADSKLQTEALALKSQQIAALAQGDLAAAQGVPGTSRTVIPGVPNAVPIALGGVAVLGTIVYFATRGKKR